MPYCKYRLECKDFNSSGCGTLGVPEQCFNKKPTDGKVAPNMEGYKQNRKHIRDAYQFLRKENHTIPDEILDFMLRVSLEAMQP